MRDETIQSSQKEAFVFWRKILLDMEIETCTDLIHFCASIRTVHFLHQQVNTEKASDSPGHTAVKGQSRTSSPAA